MCAPASACRSPGATPSCAVSMRRRRPCWWWRSRSATSSRQRGFRNLAPWSRGVDIAAFHPRPRDRDASDAADLALCRPGGDREEHQGLPRSRPARHQMGGGRRPAAQGIEAPLQGCALLRIGRHRGAVATLCRGRLLRVSQPHRHVRPGDGRGAGLRRAGRGLPRARPARRRDRARCRRRRRRPAQQPASPRCRATPRPAGAMPRPLPGNAAPSSSSPPCAPSRAASGSR